MQNPAPINAQCNNYILTVAILRKQLNMQIGEKCGSAPTLIIQKNLNGKPKNISSERCSESANKYYWPLSNNYIFHSNNSWINLIKRHQKNVLPIQTIEKNKDWFELVLNKEKPSESHFRCRLCFNYYDKFRLPKNYRNALAFEKGILKKN